MSDNVFSVVCRTFIGQVSKDAPETLFYITSEEPFVGIVENRWLHAVVAQFDRLAPATVAMESAAENATGAGNIGIRKASTWHLIDAGITGEVLEAVLAGKRPPIAWRDSIGEILPIERDQFAGCNNLAEASEKVGAKIGKHVCTHALAEILQATIMHSIDTGEILGEQMDDDDEGIRGRAAMHAFGINKDMLADMIRHAV